jgi:hypothetical protein
MEFVCGWECKRLTQASALDCGTTLRCQCGDSLVAFAGRGTLLR